MSRNSNDIASPEVVSDPYTRVEHLLAVIDHCKAAQAAAKQLDERFLAYLLAMALQEAKGAARRTR